MDHQKIPTLVIEHCLCDGCKIKLNKLNDKIPQVHSVKFYTEQGKATISGAVDPATVMEELAKEGVKPKILWEKSSPINNHHHQRQTAFPEHSLREQVHQSGSRVHGGELVHQSESKSRSFSRSRSRTRVRSRDRDRERVRVRSRERDRARSRSRDRVSRNRSKSKVDRSKSRNKVSRDRDRSRERGRARSRSRDRVSRNRSKSKVDRSKSESRVSRDRDRIRSRERDRAKSRSRDRASRNRSKSRVDRSKSGSRVNRDRERIRNRERDRARSRSRDRVSRNKSKSRVDRSKSRSRVSRSVSRSGSRTRVRVSRSVSRSRGGAHGEQIHQSGSRVRRSEVHRYEEVYRKQVHHVLSHRDGVREQVHLISREQIHRLSSFRKEVPREQVRRESHKPAEFADCYLNHKHELKEVVGFNKRFACDGCKEDGFKSRYRCERCNFDLHYECRFPKLAISPEINEELVFEFRPQKPHEERICDACGKEIHGYFYNCQAKGMDLHPCCARLKAQVRNDDMFLVLCKKVSSECLCCRKKKPPATEKGIPGWCYVSQCKKYNIHIFCLTEMWHQAWKRGLMDGTGEISIGNINFQRLAISDRNRGGRGTEIALKIIGTLRIVIGILLGDPSVFFGKLMVEFLEQLL